MKKVIAVVGPTASGKTKLAIALAQRLNAVIISCDSVAVYKDLNIGSAKPTKDELALAKHYLVDILEPFEKFDVATCQKMARDIIEKNDLSILCGGTGLYLSAIIKNYEFTSPKRDESFAANYSNYSNQELYDLLAKYDNKKALELHPNNRKRVLRALETILKTGNSLTQANKKQEAIYDAYIIYIDIEREVLYERINKRVDAMFEAGLEKEVRDLYARGITIDAIGYKEFVPYFLGLESIEQVKENIKLNTRHLAKRQRTWFKNQMTAHFYEYSDFSSLYQRVLADVLVFLEDK